MFSQKLHSVIGQVNNMLQFSFLQIQKIAILPLQKELEFPGGEGGGVGVL